MKQTFIWGFFVVLAVIGNVICEIDGKDAVSADLKRELRGKDRLDPQLQKLFGQGNRDADVEEETGPKHLKGSKVKVGRKPVGGPTEPSENGYKPEGAVTGGKGGGKKRKGGKRAGGKGLNAPGEEEEEESRRFLQSAADEFPDEADKSPEAEELRKQIRAKKHEEIHARYKERRQKEVQEKEHRHEVPEPPSPRDPPSRSNRHSESMEERMAQRHKEMRDRHTRDRDRHSGRDRSHSSTGRRERHKRPENEGRHAVLRRRINKHENLFTPEELAEIHEDLNDHKVEEDRLDKARDKLNAEFDALRDIDDRDERLEQLEVLKQKRADSRDGDRTARDSLRERFQTIRDKLEAKLKTDLR